MGCCSSSELDDDRSRRYCMKSESDVEEEEEEDDDDIISRLPDEILCNILSSFSTKESVRTSILSKRWRYVWTSVPNLIFNDSEYLRKYKFLSACDIYYFEQFMNSVLNLHNLSCIQKFRLSCRYRSYRSDVIDWINTPISSGLRNIEEIDVNVSLNRDVELPSSFFTSSKKLMVLKLCPNFFLNVPTLVHFPNLKIVRLDQVRFADDDSVKNFVAGCPVLEEFDIRAPQNLQNLRIQSSTLKKLTVSSFNNYYIRDFEFRLVIESPNLQYLHLYGFVTEDCSVNFLSSLVEVSLSVYDLPLVNADVFNNRFIRLLQNISNAKHLSLSWREVFFFAFREFGNLPVFLNLTCLTVEVLGESWGVLPFLLKLLPNLRTCDIIKKVEDFHYRCGCRWESPHCIPKCLLFCLEEIVIDGFEACNKEIEMVEYFLKNGKVLKKMSIKFVDSYVPYVREKLLAFPKASSTCKISFSSSFGW